MFIFLKIKESPNFFFILLSLIMFFFCLYFYFSNKRLKEKISKMELEMKEILERKILKNIDMNKNDLVSIENISAEVSKNFSSSKKTEKLLKKNVVESKSTISKKELPQKEKLAFNYQGSNVESLHNKNIANKSNRFNVIDNLDSLDKINSENVESNFQKVKETSHLLEKDSLKNTVKSSRGIVKNNGIIVARDIPVDDCFDSFSKNICHYKKMDGYYDEVLSVSSILDETFQMEALNGFDLGEFVQKNEKKVPKIREDVNNLEYLKEVSGQLKKIPPQTVELTEYEKNQEEHAIISYKELLALKDKIEILDDEVSNVNIIEDLKKFRNSLN